MHTDYFSYTDIRFRVTMDYFFFTATPIVTNSTQKRVYMWYNKNLTHRAPSWVFFFRKKKYLD